MLTLIQKGCIISIMNSILCLVSRMHKQQLPLVAGWNSTRPQFGYAIRAGCFVGSLDEFCEKALSEGKRRYARVVKAADCVKGVVVVV